MILVRAKTFVSNDTKIHEILCRRNISEVIKNSLPKTNKNVRIFKFIFSPTRWLFRVANFPSQDGILARKVRHVSQSFFLLAGKVFHHWRCSFISGDVSVFSSLSTVSQSF